MNYFDYSNIKLFSKREINKNDIASFMEIKNKPLIVKLNSKRSTSCLKGKKINEKIRKLNKKYVSSKFNDYEEEKRIKTPTNRIIIERDRNRLKEPLSEYINLEKNFLKLNNKRTNKIKNLKNVNLLPEENHFIAVMLSQEIKKLNKNRE